MDRRKRTARTVALMSLFSMTDTQENVPVASFYGDGSDLVSLIVGIDPVQAGSGDPSPDNVRPISGHDSATVTRTGVNVWDEEWELGTLNSNGQPRSSSTSIRCKNFIPVAPGQTYYMYSGSGKSNAPWMYGIDKSFLRRSSAYLENQAFTIPEDVFYIKIALPSTYGPTYNNDISINYPSTDHDYHAYSGTTYPIPLGQTVYGETLDVTTGKLTVTHANIASYNGESINEPWISSMDAYVAGTTPTTGAQVVYKLANPVVYDLTPTEINTLIGTNNIWADTGEIKYIEYNV